MIILNFLLIVLLVISFLTLSRTLTGFEQELEKANVDIATFATALPAIIESVAKQMKTPQCEKEVRSLSSYANKFQILQIIRAGTEEGNKILCKMSKICVKDIITSIQSIMKSSEKEVKEFIAQHLGEQGKKHSLEDLIIMYYEMTCDFNDDL